MQHKSGTAFIWRDTSFLLHLLPARVRDAFLIFSSLEGRNHPIGLQCAIMMFENKVYST